MFIIAICSLYNIYNLLGISKALSLNSRTKIRAVV